MKILLIYPNPRNEFDSLMNHPFLWSIGTKILNRLSRFPIYSPTSGYILPPLGPLAVAANTPAGIEIEFVDERIEEINFNSHVDLVGISVMTSSANHAYNTAQRFIQKGIPVVLGGIHPSLLPDEAIKYSNSVVIGEVEGLWEEILDDCKNKRLKKIYKNREFPSLKNLPVPRFDLLKDGCYLTKNIIETGRGCPHKCSFCSATKFLGNKFRFRPVMDIINEIKERKLENETVIFMSDNIFGNKNFAESLFSAIVPLNIKWMGGSSISIANYPEILRMASKSGCKSLFIGFESLTASNLNKIDKNQNPNPGDYPLLIKRIHRENIGITGSFIIGLEDDQKSIFKEVSKFVYKTNIECPQVWPLIPYPGTKIYDFLNEERRIVDYNWDHYNNITDNVVYKPRNMSISELKGIYWKIHRKVFSSWSIVKRLISTRNFIPYYLAYNISQKMKIKLF
jgi:radical SAM superfamily enzyme YgiQ (UPF0313 family)